MRDEGERSYLMRCQRRRSPAARLEVMWTYSGKVHDEATIVALAERYLEVLTELIEHCCAPGAGGYTPSDFPLSGLDQKALDMLQQTFGSPAPPHEITNSGGRS